MKEIFTLTFKELNIRKNYYVWELKCNDKTILSKLKTGEYRVHLFKNDTGLEYYSVDYMPKDKDGIMFDSDTIIHKRDINKLTNLIKELNIYIKNKPNNQKKESDKNDNSNIKHTNINRRRNL